MVIPPPLGEVQKNTEKSQTKTTTTGGRRGATEKRDHGVGMGEGATNNREHKERGRILTGRIFQN